jgi:hypothetical protein
MSNQSSQINLRLTNIPLLNLHYEFKKYFELLNDDNFCNQFGPGRRVIVTPPFQWHGLQEELLTWILQRAILGVESYISGVVFLILTYRRTITSEINQSIRNPFRLGGRGTADNFYNRLPALVDAQVSLNIYNPELFERTRDFYRSIRNPLFHGQMLADNDPKALIPPFELIRDVYRWIEVWANPTLDQVFRA